jgi:hypothetical protein
MIASMRTLEIGTRRLGIIDLTKFAFLHDTNAQMRRSCSDLSIKPTDQGIESPNRDCGLEKLQISACRLYSISSLEI